MANITKVTNEQLTYFVLTVVAIYTLIGIPY